MEWGEHIKISGRVCDSLGDLSMQIMNSGPYYEVVPMKHLNDRLADEAGKSYFLQLVCREEEMERVENPPTRQRDRCNKARVFKRTLKGKALERDMGSLGRRCEEIGMLSKQED